MRSLFDFTYTQSWSQAEHRIDTISPSIAVSELFSAYSFGRTAFFYAVSGGAHMPLLEKMVALSRHDATRRNIASLPFENGRLLIHSAASFHHNIERAKLLIREHPLGLLVHALGSWAATPLMCAVYHQSSADMVRLLEESTNAVVASDFSQLATLVGGDYTYLRRRCLSPQLIAREDAKYAVLMCVRRVLQEQMKEVSSIGSSRRGGGSAIDLRLAALFICDDAWSVIVDFM
jgi:hypothetical protein